MMMTVNGEQVRILKQTIKAYFNVFSAFTWKGYENHPHELMLHTPAWSDVKKI